MTVAGESVRSVRMCVAEMISRTGRSASGARTCSNSCSRAGPRHAPFTEILLISVLTSSQMRARLSRVSHLGPDDAYRSVIQRSYQRIGIDEQLCRAELLRKRTELAARGNR